MHEEMNEFILQADTKYIVQTKTVCATQVHKKRSKQNVSQRGWRQNYRVTDTFLTLLFAYPYNTTAE